MGSHRVRHAWSYLAAATAVCVCVCVCVCVYVYIYIYIERERESCNIYIYIYIYIVLTYTVCESVIYSVMSDCDPMNCSTPGSSVHGIFQARILQWVAIPFSKGSFPIRDRTWVSCISSRFFTAWPPRKPIMCVLCCVVLSHSVMSDSLRTHRLQPTRLLCPWGFFRQEYWSRLPCPPPGHLLHTGIKPRSPSLQADSLPSDPPGKPQNIAVGSYPFSRGSSLPRAQTRMSCIAGRFFTS